MPLVLTTVRVLQGTVLVGVRAWVVVGGCGRGPSPLLAEGLLGVGGRFPRRSWRWWSPPVSGQRLVNPGGGCDW